MICLIELLTAERLRERHPADAFPDALVRTPLMLLQDQDYTRILIVTLPETTPVLEAGALQEDLRRAKIEPFAWVINGSLAAAHPNDPIFKARAAAEIAQIGKVKQELARRVALIPFQVEEPVGTDKLGALAAPREPN